MKLIFRFLPIVALFFIIFTFSVEAANSKKPTTFTDVPKEHFAYDAVVWAQKFNIINGYDDGTFRPNEVITEQQFAKLLTNYFELESTTDELKKSTSKANWSDDYYATLASYGVPLNGYFNNAVRAEPVKRGVVAQAIAYLGDGKKNLNRSIEFLFEYFISTGQNPKYENTDIQKYFGATNHLTRAQAVTMLHRMDSIDLYYISYDAETFKLNAEDLTLNERATIAQKQLDPSLRQNSASDNMWNGRYSYVYQWGNKAHERNARYLTISKASDRNFYVQMSAYDGKYSGATEGYATITSTKKAIMQQSTNGNRCILEFEYLNNAIKINEIDCTSSRPNGTNFSGTLRKSN